MCIIYVYCVQWSSVEQLVKFKNGPGMLRKNDATDGHRLFT